VAGELPKERPILFFTSVALLLHTIAGVSIKILFWHLDCRFLGLTFSSS
jgi:hypothetical protein